MKKKGHTPITRVKNPEPNINDPDWIIWAAWADRITFEEIEKKTGKIDEYKNLGTEIGIILKQKSKNSYKR